MQFNIINTDESQRKYANPSDVLQVMQQEKNHGSRCYAVLTNDVLTVKFSTSFLRNFIDFLISYLHNPRNTFFSDRKITQCINGQHPANAVRDRELNKLVPTQEIVISQLKAKNLKVYTSDELRSLYNYDLNMTLTTKNHILELTLKNWANAEVCKLNISDQTEQWEPVPSKSLHTYEGDDRHREDFKLESHQLYRISFSVKDQNYKDVPRSEAYLVT